MIEQNKQSKIHSAECDIWSIPETSSVPVLMENGYEDEAVSVYLSNIRPLYDALSRGLAQFAGIFLLAMTNKNTEISLDHDLFKMASSHLKETKDRLHSIMAPQLAKAHYQTLHKANDDLLHIARDFDLIAARKNASERRASIVQMLGRLHSVQQHLIATAEPGAHITPVDFSQACCSCSTHNAGQSAL